MQQTSNHLEMYIDKIGLMLDTKATSFALWNTNIDLTNGKHWKFCIWVSYLL